MAKKKRVTRQQFRNELRSLFKNLEELEHDLEQVEANLLKFLAYVAAHGGDDYLLEVRDMIRRRR